MGGHTADDPPDEPDFAREVVSSWKKTINFVAYAVATRSRARSRFLLGLATGLLLSQPEVLPLLLDHWRR